jgi:hypothetical protein
MLTFSPNRLKEFKQTLSGCQKADSSCFLRQEMDADGEIHATRDHFYMRIIVQNTKKLCWGGHSKQKAWNADIQCSASPWQCASTQALLEHFNLELFHPLSYLNSWLESQCFSNNENFLENVSTVLVL